LTINIVPAKVESLFLRNLHIPEHQRGYAWKKVHADDFFEDLITTKDSNSEFYLGQFILYEQGRENSTIKDYAIIDGQQRFTTIWILFIAIRQAYKNLGEQGIFQAGDINHDLASSATSSFTTSKSIKKTMDVIQAGDWDGKFPGEGYVYQTNRIKPVYDYFKNELSEKSLPELDEIRIRVKQIDISIITLATMQEAITVFERVNARGEPLNIADLVKNHLYSYEKGKTGNLLITGLDQKWEKITENAGTGTNIVKVIRYNYMSRNGYISTSNLFRNLRKEIKNDPNEFLSGLLEFSKFYSSLRKLEDDRNIIDILDIFELKQPQEDNRFSIWKSLSGLKAYNVSQCDTLIFAYLKAYQKLWKDLDPETKGFKNCIVVFLENLEKFHYHYNLIANGPPNKVETLYANTAEKFMNITINNDLITPPAKESKNPQFPVTNKGNLPPLRSDWNKFCKLENELMRDLSARLTEENIDEEYYTKAFLQLNYNEDKSDITTIFSRMFMTDDVGKALNIAVASIFVIKVGSTWSLDHWFPQNPKDEKLLSERFNDDQNKSISTPHIDNIGNLVFLPRKPNSRSGNDLPPEKAENLLKEENANFSHVRKLIEDYSEHHKLWGSDATELRANELAKKTYKKWEFKPIQKYTIET